MKKIPSVFYQTKDGVRPVRDFILELPREDRRIIGNDIATVEYGWPIGKPICAPLGLGLWEVRSSLTSTDRPRNFYIACRSHVVIARVYQENPKDPEQ